MKDTDAASGEHPTIKVTDRRLFDSEGNLRDQLSTPTAAEPEPAAVPPDSVAATPEAIAPARDTGVSGPETVSENEVASTVEPEEPTPETDSAAESAPKLDLDDQALLKFIEEQYVGGLLALGAMPEPQSGQMVDDLDLARLRIEVLGLLQESTEGARTNETGKALEDVLYQLRMAYLQKRKLAQL